MYFAKLLIIKNLNFLNKIHTFKSKFKYKKKCIYIIKKVIIVESNKELIGRIKYYLNEYFNHTIDLLVCEDLQECIKQIHSYDVVFINDLLGASSLVLYIDSHKLKAEVIVTSNNPENYDIYKGKVSSFILSPYGYKEIVNAFNKAFNRFNDNIIDITDPTKLFFHFDEMPKFQDAINELKVSLKDKFSIDYVGIEILDRNNEYFLCKNDHTKWQDLYSEYVLKEGDKYKEGSWMQEFIHMNNSENNFSFVMSNWKHFDFRAQVIGDRKNGLYIFIYNEHYDYKLCFTFTFKESNIDVNNLDKELIKAITQEIENSPTMFKFLSCFQTKIIQHRSAFYHKPQTIKDCSIIANDYQYFLKSSKYQWVDG